MNIMYVYKQDEEGENDTEDESSGLDWKTLSNDREKIAGENEAAMSLEMQNMSHSLDDDVVTIGETAGVKVENQKQIEMPMRPASPPLDNPNVRKRS